MGNLHAVVYVSERRPLALAKRRGPTARPSAIDGCQRQHSRSSQTASRQRDFQLKTQEMVTPAGRYLACDDSIRTFAATAGRIESLDITWRSGQRTRLTQVPANSILQISESAPATTATPAPELARGKPEPFFTTEPLTKHVHGEEIYDDFARQRLLPRRLSQLGPGISCFDFNGDGWADLLIGTGRSGKLAVFRNDTQDPSPNARVRSKDRHPTT